MRNVIECLFYAEVRIRFLNRILELKANRLQHPVVTSVEREEVLASVEREEVVAQVERQEVVLPVERLGQLQQLEIMENSESAISA